jgi:hypothetical protein
MYQGRAGAALLLEQVANAPVRMRLSPLSAFFSGLFDTRCQEGYPARPRLTKPAAETKGAQASEHAYIGDDGIDPCVFEKADGFIRVSSLDDAETIVAQERGCGFPKQDI